MALQIVYNWLYKLGGILTPYLPLPPRSCSVRFRSLATELGSQQFPSRCSSEAQSGDGDGLDVPGNVGIKGEDQNGSYNPNVLNILTMYN